MVALCKQGSMRETNTTVGGAWSDSLLGGSVKNLLPYPHSLVGDGNWSPKPVRKLSSSNLYAGAKYQDMAQFGSARGLELRGRRFKSFCPDHNNGRYA